MNAKELNKMFPYLLKDNINNALKYEKKNFNSEEKFIKHLAKENKEIEAMATMADIDEIIFDVEWRKSRTWGYCPRAKWRCYFKNGFFMEGSEYASGCGYDKLSTVVANGLNRVAKGMLWRKRNSRKQKPYGVKHAGLGASKTYPPFFEGGVGTDCYYRVAEFLGGKMEWREGKTWDEIRFKF